MIAVLSAHAGVVEQHSWSMRAYGWQGPVIALYTDRDAAVVGLEGEGVWVVGSARHPASMAARFRAEGTALAMLTTYAVTPGPVRTSHR